MKLKDYLLNLTIFVQIYPEALDLDVVISSDDVGCECKPVIYNPCIMDIELDSSGEKNKVVSLN